ncbi:Hypothetical protein ARAMI_41 [Enterococcus phage Aramis]|uniref:Uncharacterized protein n=1 Tax=Enterococcus phage Aramis TaxID=2795668 RepID=A0A8D6XVF9_9CAUD|nr:Hypothetical protein ARAMI_41 [Enterococcus phage Aramis]
MKLEITWRESQEVLSAINAWVSKYGSDNMSEEMKELTEKCLAFDKQILDNFGVEEEK